MRNSTQDDAGERDAGERGVTHINAGEWGCVETGYCGAGLFFDDVAEGQVNQRHVLKVGACDDGLPTVDDADVDQRSVCQGGTRERDAGERGVANLDAGERRAGQRNARQRCSCDGALRAGGLLKGGCVKGRGCDAACHLNRAGLAGRKVEIEGECRIVDAEEDSGRVGVVSIENTTSTFAGPPPESTTTGESPVLVITRKYPSRPNPGVMGRSPTI